MNGNPRAILTGALLAAGTAGIQAVLTGAGCGPAGIAVSVTTVLTTAITVLGPKWFLLRAQRQLSKDMRWIIRRPQAGVDPVKIGTLLVSYQEKVLDAHVATIKAAQAEAQGRKRRTSRPASS